MKTIKRGRFKGKKIVMCPTDKIEADQEGIDALLQLLGHPEALVTDASQLWDFDVESQGFKVYLDREEITLSKHLFLWEAVAAIRDLQPTWPGKATRQ